MIGKTIISTKRKSLEDEEIEGLFIVSKTFVKHNGGIQQCDQLPAGTGS